MKPKLLVLGLLLSVLFARPCDAKPKSLYERFEGKDVKVYIAPVTDLTAEKAVDAETFRTKLTEAFASRQTIRFTVVPTEKESQIVISAEIADFLWTNNDPIDMLMGVGGAAMDAAVSEDYARVQANVTVRDTQSGRDLWKNRLMATVTQKPMSQAQSIPLVSENFAKALMKKAFSRPKR